MARHTRRRAKVLGEDTVLCYLFCLVSGIPHLMLGMDFWSKGLLKRRICPQRVFRSKSLRHKTFASLTVSMQNTANEFFYQRQITTRSTYYQLPLKCLNTLLCCICSSYQSTQLNANEKPTEKSYVLATACHVNHLISRCIYLRSFSLAIYHPSLAISGHTLEPRAQRVIDT